MRRERLIGLALLFGTGLAVGGGLLYAAAQRGEDGARDREHCLRGADKANTVVLVDRTDPFTADQREHVRRVVEGLAETIGRDERLALHVIKGDPQASALPWATPDGGRGFAYCKPHEPRAVNRLIETERFVRAAFERDFARPLARVLEALMAGGEAPRSPILEAIEAAAWGPVRVDRLVIVSDLLQHSEISHLGAGLPDVCAVAASPLGARLKARLAGRIVVLHQLRSARHFGRQTPQHRQWWVRLLHELDVAEVHDGARLVPRGTDTCRTIAATRKARR